MNSVKYLTKYLFLCAGLLAIAGCSTTNSTKPAKPVVEIRADSVVAQDFVNLIVQIEELSPLSSVLSFGPEDGNPSEIDARSINTGNSFGGALRSAAKSSGYEVITVDNPTGENYVSFSIAEFGDAVDGTTYTYDVSVGEIDLRRVYKPLDDGGIEPFQSMLVRGADVSQLLTDDSIFAKLDTSTAPLTESPHIKVPYIKRDTTIAAASTAAKQDQQPDSKLPEPSDNTPGSIASIDTNAIEQTNAPMLDRPVSIAAPLISDLPEGVLEGSTAESGTVAQSLAGNEPVNGFKTIRKINIAVTGESNYESLLADKKDVAEEILIFGDDSYVLGVRNKQILGEMVNKFNPDTDVISVVGCSTGVTKIVNGNAALAIGRANRVKEALLYSGISHDKIFDEGCWSPQANSTPFPNRGVVVTVKRTADKG